MYKLLEYGVIRKSDGTCIPPDPANSDWQQYLGWLSKGNTPEPKMPPSIDQIRSQLSVAVQTMLNTKAQERNYDDIKSACTYVTSTNPQFAAEAQACVAWRDAVWAMCYELLDKVTSGEISVLTEAELQAALPKLEWPEVDGTVVEEGVTVQAEQNS